MSTTSDEQEVEPDLVAWVSGRRRVILQALRFHDGEANTPEIREYTGLERGSFNHHMNALLNPPEHLFSTAERKDGEGLVEVVGEVEVGTPVPARQFALTEVGEGLFEDVIDDVSVQATDVRDLQQRVADLESENAELKERYNHMADVVDELIGQIDAEWSGPT